LKEAKASKREQSRGWGRQLTAAFNAQKLIAEDKLEEAKAANARARINATVEFERKAIAARAEVDKALAKESEAEVKVEFQMNQVAQAEYDRTVKELKDELELQRKYSKNHVPTDAERKMLPDAPKKKRNRGKKVSFRKKADSTDADTTDVDTSSEWEASDVEDVPRKKKKSRTDSKRDDSETEATDADTTVDEEEDEEDDDGDHATEAVSAEDNKEQPPQSSIPVKTPTDAVCSACNVAFKDGDTAFGTFSRCGHFYHDSCRQKQIVLTRQLGCEYGFCASCKKLAWFEDGDHQGYTVSRKEADAVLSGNLVKSMSQTWKNGDYWMRTSGQTGDWKSPTNSIMALVRLTKASTPPDGADDSKSHHYTIKILYQLPKPLEWSPRKEKGKRGGPSNRFNISAGDLLHI
jgi:hypothetical protein